MATYLTALRPMLDLDWVGWPGALELPGCRPMLGSFQGPNIDVTVMVDGKGVTMRLYQSQGAAHWSKVWHLNPGAGGTTACYMRSLCLARTILDALPANHPTRIADVYGMEEM